MYFFLALMTLAAAESTEHITVLLPDTAAPVISEISPWQAPTEAHAAPPLAWTQLGVHTVGDPHHLYDASGRLSRSCEIQAFEIRIGGLGEWETNDTEVWARLDCGSEALAAR